MRIVTLKEQETQLKKAAKKRGLKIRADKRLHHTPYRAMHKYAAIELKQPHIKKTITYDPNYSGYKGKNGKKCLVMDIRHEIIEYDAMKGGKKYKTAHKKANRKQRTIGAEK